MTLFTFLEQYGAELALGTTVLLAVGCLCVVASKVPVHRKRLGELTGWSLLVFLILAAVPLARSPRC